MELKEFIGRQEEINRAYAEGSPLLTDAEYDLLSRQAGITDAKKNYLTKEERKTKLPVTMRSLDKLKSVEDIEEWMKSIQSKYPNVLFIISPKYDGMSIVKSHTGVTYTSGDGVYGQIMNEHFKLITRYKPYCDYVHNAIGEAIIPLSAWEYVKKLGDYNVPRNTVAGLLNKDNVSEVEHILPYVNFKAYTLLNDQGQHVVDKLVIFKQYDIPCEIVTINKLSAQELTRLYNEWNEDYQCDGLVIDVNEHTVANELGYGANENPKYARAIKLPEWADYKQTVVEKVRLQVSKEGYIKPVAEVTPTEVCGVTISNVTLINREFQRDWGIESGTVVEIYRSGDVIPRISAIYQGKKRIGIPFRENYKNYGEYYRAYVETLRTNKVKPLGYMESLCPSCGEPLSWSETHIDQICTNYLCPDRVVRQLQHFMNTLGVEGFQEGTARKFYDANVRNIKKQGYYSFNNILAVEIEDIKKVEGFKDRSAEKLHAQFRKVTEEGVSLATYFDSMSLFSGLGTKTIQNILNVIGDHIYTVKDEELIQIEGVKEKTAAAFRQGVDAEKMLHRQVKITFIKEQKNMSEIKGVVAQTGVRLKGEDLERVTAAGYVVKDGITKETTVLICKDDVAGNSAKCKKAAEKGIDVISIADFLASLS